MTHKIEKLDELDAEDVRAIMSQKLGPELLAVMIENFNIKKTAAAELLCILDESEKLDTSISVEDAIDDPLLVGRWKKAKAKMVKYVTSS